MWKLMRDSRLSAGALRRVVDRRLQHVLATAYKSVPHYRQVMQQAGYDPLTDYSGPRDLRRLPILTRQNLQSLSSRLTNVNQPEGQVVHSDRSSGATGIQVTVYRNAREQSLHLAKWMRVLFANGYRVNQRVMAFCQPRRMETVKSVVQKLGLLRRRGVDYFLPAQQLTDRLFTHRPHVLYGNRCHLELVALDMKERGLRCDFLSLLVVTGEVVHANTRRLLRELYGVEPVESYGSVEMGVMAHETPDRDGLHLLEDQTFFEFLDPWGDPVPAGEAGRVIVTDLSNTLMPLIRYDQGDLVLFDQREQPDGGRLRRLRRIIGRDDDYILMPDGSRRAYSDFSNIVAGFNGIHQFRIVQKALYDFRVELVVNKGDFDRLKAEMGRRFEAKFPPPYRIGLRRVERIEPDSSGKIRKLVSETADHPRV